MPNLVVAYFREHRVSPYLDALTACGVDSEEIFLATPGRTASVDFAELVARTDGLLLTGGDDIQPCLYGEARLPGAGLDEPAAGRDQMEWDLLHHARAAGVPVFGICRGLQMLNVFAGGSLYQDLALQRGVSGHDCFADRGFALDHRAHAVTATDAEHALAERIRRASPLEVNSRHHQSIKELAPGLVPIAFAPDGILEAAATEGAWWACGVEWHPENLIGQPVHRALFADFVAAAGERRRQRAGAELSGRGRGMSAPIRLDRRQRAASLVLDRPPLQILDLDLLAELDGALAELAGDSELQLLVLAATGGKAFSAGVSIQDHTPERIDRMLLSFHGALVRLRDLDALTVAAVDGHCFGGGMELATACDLVFATERSRFGQPEIRLGCFPPVAAALYPRRIGSGPTLELLLTGRTLEAAEAERLGLVHRRCADGAALDEQLSALEAAVTAQSAAVTRLTKRAVRAGEAQPFRSALARAERLYLDELARTRDMHEGLAAFLEKRPPRWSHR